MLTDSSFFLVLLLASFIGGCGAAHNVLCDDLRRENVSILDAICLVIGLPGAVAFTMFWALLVAMFKLHDVLERPLFPRRDQTNSPQPPKAPIDRPTLRLIK